MNMTDIGSEYMYLFCSQTFLDYKDEIYEEDLQEGWQFLGRKKVGFFFVTVKIHGHTPRR